jgi:hypothetical protein
MLIGDPSEFAVESEINQAYESKGQIGLGFFNIHISGNRYGVHEYDASLLACSYHEVAERLARRGQHVFSMDETADGHTIADRFLKSYYGKHSNPEFADHIVGRRLLWAPDGDAAFDDGGHVFHIDDGNKVRLIGCIIGNDDATLQAFAELWLEGDTFYGLLNAWKHAFLADWRSQLEYQKFKN